MAESKTIVTLNEKDLKSLVCSKYKLDPSKVTISLNEETVNQRVNGCVEITVDLSSYNL